MDVRESGVELLEVLDFYVKKINRAPCLRLSRPCMLKNYQLVVLILSTLGGLGVVLLNWWIQVL